MMSRLNIEAARCEALFASSMQMSQHPDSAQVRDAVAQTIRTLGVRVCGARVAQEFGDHPEIAVARMRWAIAEVARAYARTGGICSWALPSVPHRLPVAA